MIISKKSLYALIGDYVKFKVGEVYKMSNYDDIIRVTDITKPKKFDITIISYEYLNSEKGNGVLELRTFHAGSYYADQLVHMPAYNTPLWKALHG